MEILGLPQRVSACSCYESVLLLGQGRPRQVPLMGVAILQRQRLPGGLEFIYVHPIHCIRRSGDMLSACDVSRFRTRRTSRKSPRSRWVPTWVCTKPPKEVLAWDTVSATRMLYTELFSPVCKHPSGTNKHGLLDGNEQKCGSAHGLNVQLDPSHLQEAITLYEKLKRDAEEQTFRPDQAGRWLLAWAIGWHSLGQLNAAFLQ